MAWYPIIATYNENTSKKIVWALNQLGYKADYQSSTPEKTVFINDMKEIALELVKEFKRLLKEEKFVILLTENKKELLLTIEKEDLLSEIPDRETLILRIAGEK